jgi:hypothetical protein
MHFTDSDRAVVEVERLGVRVRDEFKSGDTSIPRVATGHRQQRAPHSPTNAIGLNP